MLSLPDLLAFAEQKNMPVAKRRGIVREYLQTLMLWYLQQTSFAPKLIFIGGTALRFFYNFQRFSEDLDFNYLGVLKREDLEAMLKKVQKDFRHENIVFDFVIRKSQETYFHWKVYCQFPDILQHYGCANTHGAKLHPAEKFSLQLDFQNLGRHTYPLEEKIIVAFGKRFLFHTTGLKMFLAEKSNAILFRKVPRGRDFFDYMSIIFEGAKIDLQLMEKRDIRVKSQEAYKVLIKKRVHKLDFKALTKQLAPFLFHQEDVTLMASFPLHIDDLLKKL